MAKTTAFTEAYDYDELFSLPKFKYTAHLHEDYRNITATPYDHDYWRTCTDFRFYDRLDEIEDFILNYTISATEFHLFFALFFIIFRQKASW